MDFITVALAILIILVAFYWYLTRHFNYWRDRDVPYIPPLPILGNLKRLMLLELSPGPFLGELYNSAQAIGQRFLGIFIFGCEPALLIRDAELVKRIFLQDFDHFQNRYVQTCRKSDSIGYHNLFVVRDAKWKYLRTKLSPTFTSGKLKHMFLQIKSIGSDLTEVIAESAGRSGQKATPIDCKELIGKYTTDVINACAFGIRSNSLRDPNSEFRYFGKKIFSTGVKRAVETRAFFFMHWLVNTFRFVFFQKDSSRFMGQVFGQILAEREKNAISRNDFVDVLIKLKKDLEQTDKPEEIRELNEECVVAQAALFYTAGFETTSETIMLTLYELSLQPDIQDKLREEILQALAQTDGELNYEDVFQMKYLDMVVSETLRKYPPMPFVDRLCTKTYQIPDSDVKIPKGTPVFIPLYKGLHYDSRYFPDPDKYDPERFSSEEKANMQPFAYVPFGEGPHICLGMRFGLMNTKTTLSLILSKYRVEVCDKTRIPIEFSARTLTLNPKDELFLSFTSL